MCTRKTGNEQQTEDDCKLESYGDDIKMIHDLQDHVFLKKDELADDLLDQSDVEIKLANEKEKLVEVKAKKALMKKRVEQEKKFAEWARLDFLNTQEMIKKVKNGSNIAELEGVEVHATTIPAES